MPVQYCAILCVVVNVRNAGNVRSVEVLWRMTEMGRSLILRGKVILAIAINPSGQQRSQSN